jgi:hypothetical protein
VGEVITFCSLLWDANEKSHDFSRAYTDEWAVKLFNQFRRHTSLPNRCVLYTDRHRELPKHIHQVVQPDLGKSHDYGDCVRPYEMNVPMILVGLDTLIVANIDKMVRWCLEHPGMLALPKHPCEEWSINGVQLWGGGNPDIFANWRGQNDMDWMRMQPHERIDELWKDKVVSYRHFVLPNKGPGKARIIYFHGRKKFDELREDPFIKANWR